MKILVTGSQGVVGAKLVKILQQNGHKVFGLDLFHAPENYAHDLGKIPNENYFRADIGEYRQLEYVVNHVKPDLVYNTAAEFGRWNGEHFYEQLWKSNAVGMKNILKLQEGWDYKLVHCSSSEVYGDYNDVMFEDVTKKIVIDQMNDYAMSKKVNEQQIANSRTLYGTKTVIVRFFNTYGPGETYHPFRSVNCVFCYNLLHGKPVTVYKGHTRTSTYIDDAVKTFAAIADNFIDGEVYNITSDYLHSIEEMAESILKHTGADPSLITYKEQNEVLTTVDKISNGDKIKRDFGHTNTISLDGGIKNTVEWMKDYYRL